MCLSTTLSVGAITVIYRCLQQLLTVNCLWCLLRALGILIIVWSFCVCHLPCVSSTIDYVAPTLSALAHV